MMAGHPNAFEWDQRRGHAAFPVANVEPWGIFAAVNIAHFDGDGLTDAQTTVIHQTQTGGETGFAHGGQHVLDFLAREHNGQNLRTGDAHFFEDSPLLNLNGLPKEAASR